MGGFTRWQWVVSLGGNGLWVVVGGGSGLWWWLVLVVDCGG